MAWLHEVANMNQWLVGLVDLAISIYNPVKFYALSLQQTLGRQETILPGWAMLLVNNWP